MNINHPHTTDEHDPPHSRGIVLSICYQNVVPKVRVELTRGHRHRFLNMMRFVQIFYHEIYSLIGSPIVLAGMVCLIKGVGQTS